MEIVLARPGTSVCDRLRLCHASVFMLFSSQGAKSHRMQVVVCALLLVCILVIVIAPEVDLLPTTLRTQRLASVALIQLAVLAMVFVLGIHAGRSRLEFTYSCETPARPLLSRLSVICTRLC
jgi:hypothetical protein